MFPVIKQLLKLPQTNADKQTPRTAAVVFRYYFGRHAQRTREASLETDAVRRGAGTLSIPDVNERDDCIYIEIIRGVSWPADPPLSLVVLFAGVLSAPG